MHPSPTLTLPTMFASWHMIVLRTTGEEVVVEEMEGAWRGRTGEVREVGEIGEVGEMGEVGDLGSAIVWVTLKEVLKV